MDLGLRSRRAGRIGGAADRLGPRRETAGQARRHQVPLGLRGEADLAGRAEASEKLQQRRRGRGGQRHGGGSGVLSRRHHLFELGEESSDPGVKLVRGDHRGKKNGAACDLVERVIV